MADLATEALPLQARAVPRRRRGRVLRVVPLHIAGVLASAVFAGPVLLILLASLMTSTFATISFDVRSWTLQNYVELVQLQSFTRWIGNSVIVAVCVTALTVVVDTLAAFAFAKIDFPGRGAAFALMLGTLMLPFSVTLVPAYLIASSFGMINQYSGLIIPAIAGPFGVYLLRQFIRGIPDSIIEAARIDGASYPRVFAQIVLPLCRQPMAVLAIFTFIGNWNSFVWPLLMAQSEDMMTLPVGIATTNTQFAQNVNGINAATVLSLLPMAVLFVVFQRYFVRGALAGALNA